MCYNHPRTHAHIAPLCCGASSILDMLLFHISVYRSSVRFFFFPPQCQNILLYRHRIIFFNQLPTDGHLGRFPFFDTINNVTEDSLTNGLLSVEHIPRSGDLGSTSSQVKL